MNHEHLVCCAHVRLYFVRRKQHVMTSCGYRNNVRLLNFMFTFLFIFIYELPMGQNIIDFVIANNNNFTAQRESILLQYWIFTCATGIIIRVTNAGTLAMPSLFIVACLKSADVYCLKISLY